jgi:uncharacterized membrane protein
MQTAKRTIFGVGLGWLAFWAVVLTASTSFALDSLYYLPTMEDRSGDSLLDRRLWVYLHAGLAIPILYLAPLQFHPWLRQRQPQVHRWMGRIFLGASVLAAVMAIYLALDYELPGSRPALVVFGLLWIFFSGAAWYCAVQRDFVRHRRFMIRSVAMGFAFVWVRLMREGQEMILPFIEDVELRTTVREYLCFILPLLVVEGAMTWWPEIRKARRNEKGRPVG